MTLAISPSFFGRVTPIVRRLRGAMRPRLVSFDVLCRDLRSLDMPPLPEGLVLVAVHRVGDAHYEALLTLCHEQGLDQQWVAEQFAADSTAHVALAGGRPAGMGFVTHRPYYVAEIAHTFNPGLGGCYLYATYVRPEHRGRRLQRAIDARRMLHARSACAATTAYAVVESDNAASLRGHAAGGFVQAARIQLLHVSSRLVLAYLRRSSPRRPSASLVPNGFHLAPSLHIVRPE